MSYNKKTKITGIKPAKPEINNKPNMNTVNQSTNEKKTANNNYTTQPANACIPEK